MKYLGLLALSFLFICCGEESAPYDLVLSNVNLIDGTGRPMQSGVDVVVDDGRIVKIQPASSEKGNMVVDGSGKYLIPGLFDCHVHTTDYTEDFPKLVHYGITSVFIPGGSTCTDQYFADMRAAGHQTHVPAPRVFHTSQHFTMEGRHPVKTYASSNWREGETVFFLRDTAQISELVARVAQRPIQGIKLTIEDGPAPPFVERIPQEFVDKTVSEAAKHGLEVFAHASDNVEFLMAVKGGAQNLIHYVGIDIDWENEEHLEAVEALLDRNASIVTTLMIDKSFIYPLHPEWLEAPGLLEAYSGDSLQAMLTPAAIGRANNMAELTMEDYGLDELTMESLYPFQVRDIQQLLDRGMNMVLGTDTGNAFNFHGYSLHEEMEILETGGMAPMDILKMGTLNAARMMKAQDSLGSIEAGKLADMILLDANPLEDIGNCLRINKVYKNGQVQERF